MRDGLQRGHDHQLVHLNLARVRRRPTSPSSRQILARLARDNGFSELAYLLDLARLEAEMNAGRRPWHRGPTVRK